MPDIIFSDISTTKCTICCVLVGEVLKHPVLKVSICKACFNSVEYVSMTSDCCWCGRDNEMLFCVQCPCKCCVECITRNIGSDYICAVNEKNWSCFVCDSEPIKAHQNEYLRMISNDHSAATIPERSGTTIDISSPIITVDDLEDVKKTENRTNQYQDLDFILGIYEKQIKTSLEYDDANIPAIINEINSIKTDQLNLAIYSYKKCLNAFMSDLTNLEARVQQAEAFNNPATSIKLTSLLRILVQHHIFNRICHPQSRIKDDRVLWITERRPTSPIRKSVPSASTSKSVVMVIDPTKRKNVIIKQQMLEKKDKEVNEMVSKIKDLCSRQRKEARSDDEDVEVKMYNKRLKLSESSSFGEKYNRRPRTLITPSWLSDFRIEKENDTTMEEDVTVDSEWTDAKIKRLAGTGKRGRPPQFLSLSDRRTDYIERIRSNDSGMRRSRGRPKKTVFINVKEPRYYIQKKNGENLATSI